jgi:hypothetical protein
VGEGLIVDLFYFKMSILLLERLEKGYAIEILFGKRVLLIYAWLRLISTVF